jgi:hypothetical protein
MSQSQSIRVPWSLRLVLIASLLLLLLATVAETYRLPATPGASPTPTERYTLDTLIVPGMRIGPVTLGLSTHKLAEILGPAQLRPQGEGIVHLYPEAGLVVYTEKERVVSVTTRASVYKTRGGVGVGSDVDQVLRSLSGDYEMEGTGREYKLHNWGEGWHLQVEGDVVTYIQITTKLTDSAQNSP